MTAPILHRRLSGMLAYLIIGLAILFFRLMPLNPGNPGLPGADLTLCLSLAWVLRRPDHLPALAIAALVLVGDFLLGRPFGLWTLVVLTGTEMLRNRRPSWADQAFLFEWLRIAALMGLMLVAHRLFMIIFLIPVPALGPVVLLWLASVAAYPVVVMLLHVIGVRRLSPAELEMMVH